MTTLQEFFASIPKMAVDGDDYECGDCGFQSDDWPEFCGHRHQKHLRWSTERAA